MTEQIHKLARIRMPRAALLGEGVISDRGAPGNDDSMLFEMPSIRDGDDGGDTNAEAIDAPERHEQLSLISKVRKDIDEFDDHITQNEVHLKQARELLDGFRKFVRQTDVRLDEIHRLCEGQSLLLRQFAAEESKSEELQHALNAEKANSAAAKKQNAEYRTLLEAAREEILSQADRDRKLRKKLEEYSLASSTREAKLVEVTRNSERIAAENKVLQENYERAHFEMTKYRRSVTELQKTLDELVANGSQEREVNDRLTASLGSATEALEKYQAENIELQSQVEGLQLELRNQRRTTQGLSSQLARAAKQNDEQREQLMEANVEIAEVDKRLKALIGQPERSRRVTMDLQRLQRAERQVSALLMNGSSKAEVEIPEDQLLTDMPGMSQFLASLTRQTHRA